MKKLRIGIIGTGERGCYVLGTRIVELSKELNLEITMLCDWNKNRVDDALEHLKSQCITHKLPWANTMQGTVDYRELINSEYVDLILITTHTDQHRDPAIYALQSGKHVYLDKPISVTLEDSQKILDTEQETGNTLIMGFTRRYEYPWRKIRELLVAESIGTLQMMQIRSIIPYTRYLQMWHRNPLYSGGALNDKSSHHLDVFNWLTGTTCTQVSAIGGKSAFLATREDAPLRCSECDDNRCPYRRSANVLDDKEGTHVLHLPSWRQATDERDIADMCVYRAGADVIDHTIATYQYANGVKASLFWAIYGPHSADQETLELVGSRGRMILERASGTIHLYQIGDGEHGESMQILDARDEGFASSHYGADLQLIRDMRRFCDLRNSHQNTESLGCAHAVDGHEALRMIIATTKSILQNGTPVNLQESDDTFRKKGE
jgi:predicted dehydrogenase